MGAPFEPRRRRRGGAGAQCFSGSPPWQWRAPPDALRGGHTGAGPESPPAGLRALVPLPGAAAQACYYLMRVGGYTNVRYMEGGFTGWYYNEDLPLDEFDDPEAQPFAQVRPNRRL